MTISRRQLLVGGAAGGGLLVAALLWPRGSEPPVAPGRGERSFGAWLRIGRDGLVTVAVPQCEMGQGVTTLLPQIVAMELGADWRTVAAEPAPLSAAYPNVALAARWAPLWVPRPLPADLAPDSWFVRRWAEGEAFMATADGTTLAAYEQPCREAGAAARVLLMQAAAARWGVAWEQCETEGGFVLWRKERIRFAELVDEAQGFAVPEPVPLRAEAPVDPAMRGEGSGTPAFPRIDLPSKVDGSLPFAGDIRLPDMLYAAIATGPHGATGLKAFDPEAAKGVQGLVEVVKNPRWLAAVASNWWAADRALRRMRPTFTIAGEGASTLAIEDALAAGLKGGRQARLHSAGDPDAAFAGSVAYSASYEVAPALHGTIETGAVTARFAQGQLELWLASQAPAAAHAAAAAALGIAAADVTLYPVQAGGSFDRRLEPDLVAQAAVLARHLGRPVQVMRSREGEAMADLPRMPVQARLSAVTVGGGIAAWKARIACQPGTLEAGARLLEAMAPMAAAKAVEGRPDRLAIEGAVPPYAIPAIAIDHVPVATGLPAGRHRGNAHGYSCFFTECFIDELAERAGREPLGYRIAMLGGNLRLATCLQQVARIAGWDGGADNSGQGLACHAMPDGGAIAVVATARRAASGLKVESLVAVADVGRVVNRDIALQQIEGGMVFGLAQALGGATGYAQGVAEARRLGQLDLPRLADCPRIAVELVPSALPPADPSELAVAPVAPAIANALHSASGVRLRRLPLA